MTLYREPNTLEHAVHHTALALNGDGIDGYGVLAENLGVSINLIRKWSNPNQKERPSFDQCLAMDAVLVNAGQGTPMIAAVYEVRLELATRERPAHVPADPLERIHEVCKETGEVAPRLIKALTDPNARLCDKQAALKDIREAMEALQGAERDILATMVKGVSA